jgi:3'(2'), 5'-bisphosphate nucleotidase
MVSSIPYQKELIIAELAVQRAAILTKRILGELDKGSLSKSDASPVTIADFGAQALMVAALHDAFPDDKFLGEEDAAVLRKDETLRNRVWEFVSTTRFDGEGQDNLYNPKSIDEILDLIDLGYSEETTNGRQWTMDPVDGTMTYMQGQQYAVALALLEGGQEQIGVVACPNLLIKDNIISEDAVDRDGYGYRFVALRGHGSFMRKISGAHDKFEPLENCLDGGKDAVKRLQLQRSTPPSKIRFVDWDHAVVDRDKSRAVASLVGGTWLDSAIWAAQMRYIAVASGCTDVLMRFFADRNRKSQIYDHAGGHLVVTEAGGKVTDLGGKDIDFTVGRRLVANYGFIAAEPEIHAKVLDAVKAQLA